MAKKGPDRLAAALLSLDRADYLLALYGSGDREELAETFRGVRGEVAIGGWLEGERKLAKLGRRRRADRAVGVRVCRWP